jgi:gag-polypeptide of LTR copia-type
MTFDPIRCVGTVEKLRGAENWRKWKSDFKALCKGDGSWEWVCDASKIPTGESEVKAAKAKLTVIAWCLTMTCDDDTRGIMDDFDTAPEMYAALRKHYEGDTPAKRMELRRSLYHIKHDTDRPILHFINTIRSITAELTAIGHAPKADEIRDIVLMNLDSSFEIIRTMLASQDQNNGADWTLDALSSKLTVFEANRISRGEVSFESANLARTHRSSGHNHHLHRSRSSDNWGNIQNLPGACQRCGRSGHEAPKCFRDMPESVKDRIRHPGDHATANIASALPSNGLLNISSLRSIINSGNNINLYKGGGIIMDGDNLVGKINYMSDGFYLEDYHIKASYANADNGPSFRFWFICSFSFYIFYLH